MEAPTTSGTEETAGEQPQVTADSRPATPPNNDDLLDAAETFRQEFGKIQRDFRNSLELQGRLLLKVCARSPKQCRCLTVNVYVACRGSCGSGQRGQV
jgi:hypothetical protein